MRQLLQFWRCSFVPDAPKKVEVKVKLSDAIRLGCESTVESGRYYLSCGYACALGAAVAGAGWSEERWGPWGINMVGGGSGDEFLKDKFGMAYRDIIAAYFARYHDSFEGQLKRGELTRLQIADQFEAIGL